MSPIGKPCAACGLILAVSCVCLLYEVRAISPESIPLTMRAPGQDHNHQQDFEQQIVSRQAAAITTSSQSSVPQFIFAPGQIPPVPLSWVRGTV